LAIHDFMLIDATFAEMAEALGLPIADYDTAPAAPAAPVTVTVSDSGEIRGAAPSATTSGSFE
jgi:hypothetical protein